MNVASPLCSTLFICSLDQSPTHARPFFHGQKSVPIGGTLYSFLSVMSSPRDASAPISSLGDCLKHVALLVLADSALSSLAIQDGKLAGSARAVRSAPHGSVWLAASGLAPALEKALCERPVPAEQHRWVDQFGQAICLGSPDCPNVRSRGASSLNGW